MSSVISTIQYRIETELNYKRAMYLVLALCIEKKTVQEAEKNILEMPEMKGSAQSPVTLLKWLLECQAIEQVAENNVLFLKTTQEGLQVLDEENKKDKIGALLESEAQYLSVYELVLENCQSGKSRQEIEKLLEGNSLLESPKLYPSYFIDNLEKAGGLFWNDKWFTSAEGLEKLPKKQA